MMVKNNSLLLEMIKDMSGAEDNYRPDNYWMFYIDKIVKQLKNNLCHSSFKATSKRLWCWFSKNRTQGAGVTYLLTRIRLSLLEHSIWYARSLRISLLWACFGAVGFSWLTQNLKFPEVFHSMCCISWSEFVVFPSVLLCICYISLSVSVKFLYFLMFFIAFVAFPEVFHWISGISSGFS